MARRHTLQAGNWVSVVRRLEELILANHGGDPFEEVFKLLLAKLVDERQPQCEYVFQAQEDASSTARNINGLLNSAMDQWPGLVNGDDAESPHIALTDNHLQVCVEELQGYQIANAGLEVFDSIFESLATRSSKGAKGQFFTPRHVVEAGVQILAPQADDYVVDPACGSCGFLVHSLNMMNDGDSDGTQASGNSKIWGFEFDGRARRIGKALLTLAGGQPETIIGLNSLRTPDTNYSLFDNRAGGKDEPIGPTIEDVLRTRMRNFDGFDVLLTNPPFAGEVKEDYLINGYELARSSRKVERDVLFLERCVQLLRPGGRFGIVLPDNKVGSKRWEYVRKWLLEQVRVVAVLGLARNTFQPHTHQKASFLFGIKRPPGNRMSDDEDILFLRSEKAGKNSAGEMISKEGTDPHQPAWERADHDLKQAVEEFHMFIDETSVPWGYK